MMPILRETIETTLPRDEAFALIADFANAAAWDPGTATSERVDDGPVGVGARYRLGVRMRGRIAPMEYRITTFEAPRRVVLAGSGSGVRAIDDIRFQATAGGTRIGYTAEIHLTGLMRLLEPLAGGAFATIAREARDGMQRTLDERARAAATAPSAATAPPAAAGAAPAAPAASGQR
jgi:carbon monoxide dehydrogenase subunit G